MSANFETTTSLDEFGLSTVVSREGNEYFTATAGNQSFEASWTTNLSALSFAKHIRDEAMEQSAQIYVITDGPIAETSAEQLEPTLEVIENLKWVRVNFFRRSFTYLPANPEDADEKAVINVLGDDITAEYLRKSLEATASPQLVAALGELMTVSAELDSPYLLKA